MIFETLKKSSIFSVLPEAQLREISHLFQVAELNRDQFLFIENDHSDWIFVASRGRVKIVKRTIGGKDVILEIKQPGEVFCCAAVLDKKPYPESAQAMENASVIRISRKDLQSILKQYPRLELEFAKYASEKLRDAHETLKDIASETADKRIAALLLKIAEKIGIEDTGFIKIDFHLTRQQIAEMVGTTVETCIRMMSRFQKEGMIKSSGSRILVNIKAVRRFLENDINL